MPIPFQCTYNGQILILGQKERQAAKPADLLYLVAPTIAGVALSGIGGISADAGDVDGAEFLVVRVLIDAAEGNHLPAGAFHEHTGNALALSVSHKDLVFALKGKRVVIVLVADFRDQRG